MGPGLVWSDACSLVLVAPSVNSLWICWQRSGSVCFIATSLLKVLGRPNTIAMETEKTSHLVKQRASFALRLDLPELAILPLVTPGSN